MKTLIFIALLATAQAQANGLVFPNGFQSPLQNGNDDWQRQQQIQQQQIQQQQNWQDFQRQQEQLHNDLMMQQQQRQQQQNVDRLIRGW
jgi:multidrug resistance efflux pump